MENTAFQENWQVDVNGEIYDTDFEGLVSWIAEGSLLPGDKVRRGNLRWLYAGKVPALHGFFNARELGVEPPPIPLKTINCEDKPELTLAATENFSSNDFVSHEDFQTHQTVSESVDGCNLHPELEPKYLCETCGNKFCRDCPAGYGESVKICPFCGAMCKPIVQARIAFENEIKYQTVLNEGFGFSDFGRAFTHPFKFKVSLISGAIMFMLFSLGQQASGIGGIFMYVATIFCLMLANMLTFGVLANTVENFSQGKLETDFMPSFDDFNIWDDVVHPLFLSIGAYLVSFGLFVAIVVGGIWFMFSSIIDNVNEQNQILMQESRDKAEKLVAGYKKDFKNLNAGNQNSDDDNGFGNPYQETPDEEAYFNNLQREINESRKRELESMIGKTPETQQAEFQELIKQLSKIGIPLVILAGIAFIWGIFYFPAACAVAGYTRSYGATINPLVGLDTIKHLGTDYIKFWVMGFILLLMSAVVGIILNIIFSPFYLPGMGNLPAKAIGSLFGFYFSVVFSVTLGYALFKNSDKLALYRD